MKQDAQTQSRAERIETLVQQVSSFSNIHARETTEELVQCILDMYGECLARILELSIQADAAGFPLVRSFTRDDLIGSLLILHGLHPVDLETRVMRALDEVRPQLVLHGGNVEFLKIEDNVAYLRLNGSCHGCPSSTVTLKQLIEGAVRKAAPDLERLDVDGVADGTTAINPDSPPGITCGVPITFVPPRRNREGAQLAVPGKSLKNGR
ncbi:MAG TPA: NifU family protein [Ktedonobacteraceae bacterium]|nr:NifU family protein [Ktedonobacteraceae bacterium]